MSKYLNSNRFLKRRKNHFVTLVVFSSLLACFAVVVYGFARHSFDILTTPAMVQASAGLHMYQSLEEYTVDFLTSNGADELIPIIACESEFQHYEEDGSVLMNREGSSATGIAQILASVHPDPYVLRKYNRRSGAAMKVDDFDITTPIGNLEYALVLYQTRGTRDWECAKKI